ncbi:endonuclease/exonuclease/phosphatase family protein [Microbacterium invictum]|uniref:Endonuclease/exonuclease/phosphatase (EEP) superfamily protein YafD n=1 Tax=Microbacterium invictum TaxID=515415 RepID=A0AA40SMC1_9MICO|nr:endonuclease/exonuclease/phosphatase family protein [Microbacterium invictum]MBB4138774.1 endonuclease/exonuclease/phosphatase (EEP) superfamily protein YafD [Microbacterium invictum]
MLRLLGILVTLVAAIGAAVLTWPQFFRLEQTFPFAQIVSLRGVVVTACAVLAVVMLLLCLIRPMRAFAASVLVIAVVTGVINGGILFTRGTGESSLTTPGEEAIRVMTWNTAGAATDASIIAKTAVAMQVDIVALPETSIETGTEVAVLMREMGRPMWAHHEDFGDQAGYEEWDANSTSLLISPDLGDYAVVESESAGTSNTSQVPSVVAMPVDGEGPIVVAVHAVAPRAAHMAAWRADLQWLADQCAADDVIMAGDFNATVDHMERLGVDDATLGRCRDATTATGNGGVGTWSTEWPALLGAPIDHVLATDAWTATGSVVLDSLDGSGGDHRPVVVQFERAR